MHLPTWIQFQGVLYRMSLDFCYYHAIYFVMVAVLSFIFFIFIFKFLYGFGIGPFSSSSNLLHASSYFIRVK